MAANFDKFTIQCHALIDNFHATLNFTFFVPDTPLWSNVNVNVIIITIKVMFLLDKSGRQTTCMYTGGGTHLIVHCLIYYSIKKIPNNTVGYV